MKMLTTKALLLAIGAALAARTASAQNVYNNGDLFLAFRESGIKDLVVDIGQTSTYLNTATTINLDTVVASYGNVTYPTLSSLVDHVFGSASGVTWSVVGTPALGSPFSGISLTDPSLDTSKTPSSSGSLNNAGSAFQSYASPSGRPRVPATRWSENHGRGGTEQCLEFGFLHGKRPEDQGGHRFRAESRLFR